MDFQGGTKELFAVKTESGNKDDIGVCQICHFEGVNYEGLAVAAMDKGEKFVLMSYNLENNEKLWEKELECSISDIKFMKSKRLLVVSLINGKVIFADIENGEIVYSKKL